MTRGVLCVDLGSTFTKAVLVDPDTGDLLGTAEHRTTLDTDVMDGIDACRERLDAADAELLACSSAGGGLRIAVVGNEELVTAEAGRRVALSSGGKVALVSAGGLSAERYAALVAAAPDVVLLVGGTDGGNAEVLEGDAEVLAAARWAGPVVVAGNVDSQTTVAASFEASRTPYVLSDNVVPRIGVLAPGGARLAIREMFLRHVIGGKQLSTRADLAEVVRGPTPDLVLDGVEVLSAEAGLDVVVVDVGGATTDVHSVCRLDPEDASLARDVVAPTPVTRTVEGDLGMRWSAVSTWEAGREAGLPQADDVLGEAASRLRTDPAQLPAGAAGTELDLRLATIATTVALRRHAGRARVVLSPEGRVVERSGTDLRQAGLLVGSGGVLRHAPPERVRELLASLTGHSEAGWQLPAAPRAVVDRDHVLAAVGLLRASHPRAAGALARRVASWQVGAD